MENKEHVLFYILLNLESKKKITRDLTRSVLNAKYEVLLNSHKVTVQFETEGNGRDEIVSYLDRSEAKL